MIDRYGGDVLAGSPKVIPEIAATGDVVAEDPASGFCGLVVGCSNSVVTLEDRHGVRRNFPLDAAFLIDGKRVRLIRPVAAPRGSARSASGSIRVDGLRARTAQQSRIWVEGVHDATLIERIWGHDLRVEGIVVEPIGGLDNLVQAVADFGPSRTRRVGVLADHLVPGSKETRIAQAVSDPHVLVTGHRFVDIWQAVRADAVGIPAWPQVPRGTDWKQGVCRALGVADVTTMWGMVNGAVSSYRQIDTSLVTAVEMLIDFVTEPVIGS